MAMKFTGRQVSSMCTISRVSGQCELNIASVTCCCISRGFSLPSRYWSQPVVEAISGNITFMIISIRQSFRLIDIDNPRCSTYWTCGVENLGFSFDNPRFSTSPVQKVEKPGLSKWKSRFFELIIQDYQNQVDKLGLSLENLGFSTPDAQ